MPETIAQFLTRRPVPGGGKDCFTRDRNKGIGVRWPGGIGNKGRDNDWAAAPKHPHPGPLPQVRAGEKLGNFS